MSAAVTVMTSIAAVGRDRGVHSREAPAFILARSIGAPRRMPKTDTPATLQAAVADQECAPGSSMMMSPTLAVHLVKA
jgi:hypothetical protein